MTQEDVIAELAHVCAVDVPALRAFLAAAWPPGAATVAAKRLRQLGTASAAAARRGRSKHAQLPEVVQQLIDTGCAASEHGALQYIACNPECYAGAWRKRRGGSGRAAVGFDALRKGLAAERQRRTRAASLGKVATVPGNDRDASLAGSGKPGDDTQNTLHCYERSQ